MVKKRKYFWTYFVEFLTTFNSSLFLPKRTPKISAFLQKGDIEEKIIFGGRNTNVPGSQFAAKGEEFTVLSVKGEEFLRFHGALAEN